MRWHDADDLAVPLHEVTFVVLDLETTGCAGDSDITEIGAVRLRGGEDVGVFHTLVDGATTHDETVPLGGALAAFAEFVGDAVVVGHNVAFDLRFLQADLARLDLPPLTDRVVDTLALARRFLRDDIPDCRLSSVAGHLGTVVRPRHRALDDARATAEVLHLLLERVASLGVTCLDDLLALPRSAGHPQVAKLGWTAPLPRRPGVRLLLDGARRVLSVDAADDLRTDVRSLFETRDGRRVGPLLREAQALDHVVCRSSLEAEVVALRLRHHHLPRYDRDVPGSRWRRLVRVHTDGAGGVQRAVVVRTRTDERPDRWHLGPFAPDIARAIATTLVDGATDELGDVERRALDDARTWRRARLALVSAGRVVVDGGDGAPLVLDRGRLDLGTDAPPAVHPEEAAADEAELLARRLLGRR